MYVRPNYWLFMSGRGGSMLFQHINGVILNLLIVQCWCNNICQHLLNAPAIGQHWTKMLHMPHFHWHAHVFTVLSIRCIRCKVYNLLLPSCSLWQTCYARGALSGYPDASQLFSQQTLCWHIHPRKNRILFYLPRFISSHKSHFYFLWLYLILNYNPIIWFHWRKVKCIPTIRSKRKVFLHLCFQLFHSLL